MAAPDFVSLSRKAALAAIAELAGRSGPSPAAAVVRLLTHLTEGLRDLTDRYVPANWI